MTIRAVIFDLEGTLVDDMRFQYEAWSHLAGKLGALMSESVFHSFNGMTTEETLGRLLGRAVGPSLAETFGREKEEHYRENYRPHLAAITGASELLARLRADGMKLGLATSASTEDRAMVLDGLGWNDAFDVVVTADGMSGKPSPDIFLAAATKLGVSPSECLAFEDSWNGVTAASAAGMAVVGITTNVDAEVLLRGGAVRTIANYDDVPADIEQLLDSPG